MLNIQPERRRGLCESQAWKQHPSYHPYAPPTCKEGWETWSISVCNGKQMNLNKEHLYFVSGNVTMENNKGISQKISNKITMWSSHSISVYSSKDCKNTNLKIVDAPLCSLQHFLQQPSHGTNLFLNEWICKENVLYIHNVTLFSYKKKEIQLFGTIWLNWRAFWSNVKTNTVCSEWHVESKTPRLLENRLVVSRDGV